MWNPFNFLRGKAKREEEINKILGDLENYKTTRTETFKDDARYLRESARKFKDSAPGTIARAGKGTIKVLSKGGGVAATGIAAGTFIAPGPVLAVGNAKAAARSEIFAIAERITAQKYRESKGKPRFSDIKNSINEEIEKQFMKKQYKIDWFAPDDTSSIVVRGMSSGKDKYMDYESQYGGRLSGQAVQKLEQVGGAASTAARTVGLYGKVPTQPAKRTEQLDPNVRSAINKARIELQKVAKDIYEKKYKSRLNEINKEAGIIQAKLKEKNERLQTVTSRLNQIIAESKGETAANKPKDAPEDKSDSSSYMGG